jgi:hypothetical protein
MVSQRLMDKGPLLHMSILTYYPFCYYHKNSSQDFLLTENPLTHKTVSIIGGEAVSPHNFEAEILYLINIREGVEPVRQKLVEKEIEKGFSIENVERIKDIEIKTYRRKIPY